MKYIFIFTLLFLLGSCATKSVFTSLEDVKAKTINRQTKNVFFQPKKEFNPLYVRVNFIHLLDENGEGNFNGKNDEDNVIMAKIFEGINRLYANLKDPKDSICYTGKDFIKNTKIQFKFNQLFIKDSFARNYRNAKGFSSKSKSIGPLSPSKNWYLSYLDKNISDTIIHKGINAFNTMDVDAYNDLMINNSGKGYDNVINASISQFPSYTDLNRSSQINFTNKYTKRQYMEKIYAVENNKSWDKKVKGWFIGSYKGVSHEIGHSLSLAHSNEYHRTNKCDKAMMSQNGYSHRNYIQPTEIGKMHKALMTSNLIQFVSENSNYGVPKLVSENENWKFKTIRFYQDIIVAEGKVLILNGTVILPENASITLEKNATLVLNKAILKTAKNNPFTNIIINKNGQIIRY